MSLYFNNIKITNVVYLGNVTHELFFNGTNVFLAEVHCTVKLSGKRYYEAGRKGTADGYYFYEAFKIDITVPEQEFIKAGDYLQLKLVYHLKDSVGNDKDYNSYVNVYAGQTVSETTTSSYWKAGLSPEWNLSYFSGCGFKNITPVFGWSPKTTVFSDYSQSLVEGSAYTDLATISISNL